MKSIKEQREDEFVEELAKYMFDDSKTWPHMAEVTREYWRLKVRSLLKTYLVRKKCK